MAKTSPIQPYSNPTKVARSLEKSKLRLATLDESVADFERVGEFKKVDKKYLAPSFIESLLGSLSSIVKPASLITFGLVCLYGLLVSYFVIKEEVTKPSEAEQNIASAKLSQEYEENLKKTSDTNDTRLSTQRRQITYISGLITMHRRKHEDGTEDAGTIARHIVSVADELDEDPFYIAAIIATESTFRTRASSRVKAVGLMQLMAPTAKEVYNKTLKKKGIPNRNDSRLNVVLGTTYVQQLERRYKGNRFNALAAYNWGPGNLNKALSRGRRIPKSVRKYSNDILKKALRWRKLYNRAEAQSKKFS